MGESLGTSSDSGACFVYASNDLRKPRLEARATRKEDDASTRG